MAAAAADDGAGVTLQCGRFGDVVAQPWLAVANAQHAQQLDLTSETFVERGKRYPEVYAFHDRNSFADDFERRIFIVHCGEGSEAFVFLFNEDSSLVDEPGNGTSFGRQPLVDADNSSAIFRGRTFKLPQARR